MSINDDYFIRCRQRSFDSKNSKQNEISLKPSSQDKQYYTHQSKRTIYLLHGKNKIVPFASSLRIMPRLRSPNVPFSFKYWLNKLQVCEKADFSCSLADFWPDNLPASEKSDELDILSGNWTTALFSHGIKQMKTKTSKTSSTLTDANRIYREKTYRSTSLF